jgi:hypothetical protein
VTIGILIPLNLVEFGQHVEPLYYNETEVSFEVYFEISKSVGIVNGFLLLASDKISASEIKRLRNEYFEIYPYLPT